MRLAAWIGAGEGLLALVVGGTGVHVAIYVLAVTAVAFYVMVVRNYKSSDRAPAGLDLRRLAGARGARPDRASRRRDWARKIAIALIAVVALVMLFAESKRESAVVAGPASGARLYSAPSGA